MTPVKQATTFPFQRLMVLNATPEPDLELLSYSAMLARCADPPRLVVATPAGEMAMTSLAPCSRLALAGRPEAELSFRVMLEPHLDLLFEMAQESECDLIVARHPRGRENSRALLRRLLYDSPCAVCLVPARAPRTLRRPMVRVEPTAKGRALLAMAAAFSSAARSEELFAVHPYFRYGLDLEAEPPQMEQQRTLDFYKFLSRTNLSGVNCTPILEESPKQSEGLLRLAKQRGSDMLIIDPDSDKAPVWQWNRREAGSLARAAHIALLAARIAPPKGPIGVLRERVFCGMEPMFN